MIGMLFIPLKSVKMLWWCTSRWKLKASLLKQVCKSFCADYFTKENTTSCTSCSSHLPPECPWGAPGECFWFNNFKWVMYLTRCDVRVRWSTCSREWVWTISWSNSTKKVRKLCIVGMTIDWTHKMQEDGEHEMSKRYITVDLPCCLCTWSLTSANEWTDRNFVNSVVPSVIALNRTTWVQQRIKSQLLWSGHVFANICQVSPSFFFQTAQCFEMFPAVHDHWPMITLWIKLLLNKYVKDHVHEMGDNLLNLYMYRCQLHCWLFTHLIFFLVSGGVCFSFIGK
jgi:hypothetical protein